MAEFIGPERIAGRPDPAQATDHATLIRIGEMEIRRKDCGECDQQQHCRARDADWIPRESPEYARPIAARLVDGGDADEILGDRAHLILA